jgi:FkbM family methyltransferase
MVHQYGCRVIAFEPVPQYCSKIRSRFANNSRVEVIEAGLAGSEGEATFVVDGVSSSVFPVRQTGNVITVKLVDVLEVFEEHRLTEVACMKVNIEGGEYELLERMVQLDLIRRVRSYLIQFHSNVPSYAARRQSIRAELAKTHRLVFDYPFVWERWDRTISDTDPGT